MSAETTAATAPRWAEQERRWAEVGFAPVIIGGDAGAYGAARAFHEAYGINSVVLSKHQMWMIRHSRIIEHLEVENGTVMEHVRTGLVAPQISRLRERGIKILLLGAIDSTVEAIIELRETHPEDLGTDVLVPYVDSARFEAGTVKDNFTALAERLGVDHPVTRVVDFSRDLDAQLPLDLSFPVWAKPADVTAWYWTEFEGKHKVHRVETPQALHELFTKVHDAGYRASFVIQEEVPGDDQNMRVLTCYADQDSVVRFASWGETVLEDHSPAALGNPSVILSTTNTEAVDQAQLLLAELGWVGYANFDLKYDPRDAKTKFFELNPRLGRSNYYITGAGNNPVEYYVRDWIRGELSGRGDTSRVEDQQETVYTVLPRWLTLRYVSDPARRRRIRAIMRSGRSRNPFFYSQDRDPRRLALLLAAQASTVRKFLRFYPPSRVSGE
ncbi:hypothetical protein [Nesterenkonia lutea]|uniref:D-aspartate ligase n=1 Tax=Nesterenkonia lutea TaxID=272919 RepID=A0ABR9JHP2_9MICC|nr:hypothetical protein [Nesterenkonia lutea]MBE1525424.1 D-aspartate ligase [Nesterenkonia lutea]